jgi:hypothetical protein
MANMALVGVALERAGLASPAAGSPKWPASPNPAESSQSAMSANWPAASEDAAGRLNPPPATAGSSARAGSAVSTGSAVSARAGRLIKVVS